MATDIVQGLFGLTPEAYQAEQNRLAQAEAMRFAQLDPFQQANYGLYMGGRQLGNVVGQALGAQDPTLQRISQTQSLLKSIDPSDPRSLAAGIQAASQFNPQLALSLSDSLQKLQKNQADIFKSQRETLSTEQKNAAALADASGAARGSEDWTKEYSTALKGLTTKKPGESMLKAQAIVDARAAVRNTPEGTPERARAEDMLRALQMDKYDITEIGVPGNPSLVQKVFIDKFDPNAKPIPLGGPMDRYTSKVSATATTGENQYGSTFGGGMAKDDLALRAAANSAEDIIKNADATENILKGGNVITGTGANAKLNILAFGQAVGATGKTTDELIANTQQLQQQRSTAVLQQIKSSGLGTGQGFTDKDLKFLQDSAAGRITLSQETIQRQLDAERNAARALAGKWNKRLTELPQAVVKPMGLSPVELPAKTSFTSVEEAMAAKLPKGTQITINGRRAVVE